MCQLFFTSFPLVKIQHLHEFIIEFYSRRDCFESNRETLARAVGCSLLNARTLAHSHTHSPVKCDGKNKRDLQHIVIEHKSLSEQANRKATRMKNGIRANFDYTFALPITRCTLVSLCGLLWLSFLQWARIYFVSSSPSQLSSTDCILHRFSQCQLHSA